MNLASYAKRRPGKINEEIPQGNEGSLERIPERISEGIPAGIPNEIPVENSVRILEFSLMEPRE